MERIRMSEPEYTELEVSRIQFVTKWFDDNYRLFRKDLSGMDSVADLHHMLKEWDEKSKTASEV